MLSPHQALADKYESQANYDKQKCYGQIEYVIQKTPPFLPIPSLAHHSNKSLKEVSRNQCR